MDSTSDTEVRDISSIKEEKKDSHTQRVSAALVSAKYPKSEVHTLTSSGQSVLPSRIDIIRAMATSLIPVPMSVLPCHFACGRPAVEL